MATNGGGRTAEFICDADVPISYRVEGHGGWVGTYSEAGSQYLVYATGVRGVGVVLGVVYYRSAGSKPVPVYRVEAEAYSGDSGTSHIGATFYMKLVRTGPISNGSGSTIHDMVIEARLYENGSATPLRKQVYLTPTTLKIGERPSCRMRTQNVPMGKVAVSAFKGVGSVAAQRSYEVVLDCEADVGRVDYQVSPTTPVVNIEEGIAEATGGVQGVGYQFLQGNGSPLQFLQTYEFGYGSTVETQLKKTFGVRYRQTAPTIVPGEANAGLTYTITVP